MRILVFVFISFVVSLFPLGGRSEIVWLEKEYDFGLMKEEAGPKTGYVRLVNTGPDEAVITGARPSCGCTGVAYNEDPIAPGDTVKFSFTYDPLGRPGRFEKSIRVYIGDFDMATIKIRGNVLGTPESLSSLYPIEAGPLRLSERLLPAGDVTYGSTRHFFINGYNQTADTIRPRWECPDPALSVSASSEEIGPGDIVTFSFYFNSREKTEMGPVEIPVTISSDNKKDSPETEVVFTAKVIPDFSRMTPEEVKDAPKCYLAPHTIDLGSLSSSTKNPVKFKFAIRNEGKTEMRVMRVFSQSQAIRISRYPATIKPEKSADSEGSLNINKLPPGPFNIKIEVLTNDPLHPARTISIVGIKE